MSLYSTKMSTIHNLTAVTPIPEFELFAVPNTQTTVERSYYTEHRPVSTLDAKSTLEFEIQSAMDEYINFSETFIHLQVGVQLKNLEKGKASQSSWTTVKPVNNFLHSLFKTVDISIGNTQINPSSTMYAYRSYLETLLGTPKNAKETYLSASLWYDDESKRKSYIEPKSATSDWTKGRLLDLYGRLHVDLSFQERALLGGCKVNIKLQPNDPKFFFITGGDVIPEIKFKLAELYVHKFKVYPEIVTAHAKALQVAPAKYPVNQVEVNAYTVNKGNLDARVDNAFLGQIPRRLFVTVVSNNAFIGDYESDPFVFTNYDCNYCCCFVNGIQYPSKAYTPDYDNGVYMRPFTAIFTETNQTVGNVTSTITRESFPVKHCIYAFNFSADLSEGCHSGHVNMIKTGTLRIEMHFKKALSETVNILTYAEFDKIYEIPMDRLSSSQLKQTK